MATKTTATRTASKKKPARPASKPRRTATQHTPVNTARKASRTVTAVAAPVADLPRRAVFVDVENTSNETELARALDELKIDPRNGVTQVSAIGNWRVVGQQLGRSLAERGAVLVHSAPAPRIRDWSDLWIAVQAGIWLGRARAGDIIEIVSHDRAFDAVGDAAAQLGVIFRRITYRPGAVSDRERQRHGSALPAASDTPHKRRRRGGRGRSRSNEPTIAVAPSQSVPPIAAPARVVSTPAEAVQLAPHGASPQELRDAIARLVLASSTGVTTLDALTLALKAAGFTRPPGSPRLVTRIRQLAGVEVLPGGKLRLREGSSSTASAAELSEQGESDAPQKTSTRRRRRGRGRRGGQARQATGSHVDAPGENQAID